MDRKRNLKTVPVANLLMVMALSIVVGVTLFSRQDTTPEEGSAQVENALGSLANQVLDSNSNGIIWHDVLRKIWDFLKGLFN